MEASLSSAAARLSPSKLEHERLTSLINSMADGVIAVDKQMHIVVYNGAALNILDLNSSMEHKLLDSVFKPFDKNNQPVDIVEYVHAIKTPKIDRDLRLKYNDDSYINLYLSVAPVYQGYGKAGQGGYVLVLRDITHEKSLEEERDEFISVVSHELRTPIAIAEGNISNAQFIAGKSADIKEIKKTLDGAHEQILFLGGLINDLATLSRAERGKLNVDIETINAHDLIEELVTNYKPEAEQRGLTISSELDPHLELLKSSKLYVREILQNFITNSLKYTEKGGVTLGAKPKDNGVLFTVRDTGIGISKGDQERVFDKFFRSEDFRTRKTNGTGLGLYVTMKLSQLIHADINVESELNKGSTFSIYIPNLQ
jgi:two-component system, OmpR family, phosphate regulon sensor histidine kinase PhoR